MTPIPPPLVDIHARLLAAGEALNALTRDVLTIAKGDDARDAKELHRHLRDDLSRLAGYGVQK